MKNVIIIVLAIISAVLAAILFANKDNIGAVETASVEETSVIKREFTGPVVAKVNGKPVTEQEVKERLNFVMGPQASKVKLEELSEQQVKAIATEAAVQRLILEKAYEAGINNNPELKNRIEDLVENIYKEKFLESVASKKISAEEVKKVYEELVSKAKNSDQFKVRHILSSSEEGAKKARGDLKKRKFADVAKEKSLDKLSAERGGDLGYIFPEEYVVEFAETVKKLKNNEVSKPIKTQFGWHIIKVEDRRKAEIVPLDTARPRIEKQIGATAVKEFIDSLSKDMQVEVIK